MELLRTKNMIEANFEQLRQKAGGGFDRGDGRNLAMGLIDGNRNTDTHDREDSKNIGRTAPCIEIGPFRHGG